MAKIVSKFGEQQLVMVNYACGFNQSETEKYFECIIIQVVWLAHQRLWLSNTHAGTRTTTTTTLYSLLYKLKYKYKYEKELE